MKRGGSQEKWKMNPPVWIVGSCLFVKTFIHILKGHLGVSTDLREMDYIVDQDEAALSTKPARRRCSPRESCSALSLLEFLNNSCDQIKMLLKFSPLTFLVQLPLISASFLILSMEQLVCSVGSPGGWIAGEVLCNECFSDGPQTVPKAIRNESAFCCYCSRLIS